MWRELFGFHLRQNCNTSCAAITVAWSQGRLRGGGSERQSVCECPLTGGPAVLWIDPSVAVQGTGIGVGRMWRIDREREDRTESCEVGVPQGEASGGSMEGQSMDPRHVASRVEVHVGFLQGQRPRQ